MKTLAIFYGGKSAEHDISIITGLQVIKALDKQKYDVVPVYIDYDNSWNIALDYDKIYNYAKGIKKQTHLASGFFDGYLLKKTALGFKKFKKIDVAINCCHGLNGEDGTLSGVFELGNVAYVGSGVLASAVSMDKVVMKNVFEKNNLPCCKYTWFRENDFKEDSEKILSTAEEKLGYPIIVKPANLGSSIGINIAKNRQELEKNIKIALNFDKKVILEEVIENLREINCSCIGNSATVEVSILEEPKGWKEFLDFNEKYISATTDKVLDVKIGRGIDKKIKEYSKLIFKLLGCSGVVRIDYMLNDKTGKLYVNEINTTPGSFANYLWKSAYNFSALLDKLIELAEDEKLCKNANKYAHKSNVLSHYKNTGKSGSKLKIKNGC